MRRCAAPARSHAPVERRTARQRRRHRPDPRVPLQRFRRRRAWQLAPLSLVLLAPWAQGASFQPGTPADPPTGDVTANTPREPLAGNGIRWTLAPWRQTGSVALDLRALRVQGSPGTRQALVVGDVDLASYIWQPWFVQVRLGAGVVGVHSSGDAQGSGSQGGSLTGRAAISVFPASRFPFELRADVSENRSGGDTLSGDFRTTRLSLSQGYRPLAGNDNYQLLVDHSVLDDGASRDVLTTFNATALRQAGAHTFDAAWSHSDNQRSDADEHTRLTAVSARHGFHPAAELNVDSLASWNELRLQAGAADVGTDVRQLSSFVSWRPAGGPGVGVGAPLVAATARWVDARTLGDETVARVQAYHTALGYSQELTPAWRVALSGSASHQQGSPVSGGDSATTQASATWAPPTQLLGGWRYVPQSSVNGGLNKTSEQALRRLAGAQASHAVSRDVKLGAGQMLTLNASQSGAVLHESGEGALARALAHGLGLSWQSLDSTGGQSFGGLSYSDARTWGGAGGHFQIANLQLSQRTQLSRYASWSANLTLQYARNQASELDVFTGQRRDIGNGWQRFYNGGAAYEHQRAFGVPRLRHSLLLALNSQSLERRALGDIDAPRERISASLESRLEYAIGRLDTRLSARVARVDGRSVAILQARAQRRF